MTVVVRERATGLAFAECYDPEIAERIARLLNTDVAVGSRSALQLEHSLDEKIRQVQAIREALEAADVGAPGPTLADGVRYLAKQRDEYRAAYEKLLEDAAASELAQAAHQSVCDDEPFMQRLSKITAVVRAAIRWRRSRRKCEGRATHEDVVNLDAAVDELSEEDCSAVGELR